ncbi:alpha/beta hydrolase [Frankia sp. Ag45/Mut15]|uniref:Alpha/beta hydrolase n=1 Tax=Frankia umida TaxID=573489 RepID=A0ABT0JSP4_9ACTN|nr:alpha/beta hydrolase [Frankia umida]MCK9874588.1 alpha/beta hydrolase [Frankia umida]
MSITIPGFDYTRVPVGEVTLQVAVGGAGSPVVLLHGFPQTHLAWRHVAADLATDHLVVCPDLRGYGASDKPADDLEHSVYSKRTMAADVVELMRRLGHERFAVVGHDRGAGVAFRAGLDQPEHVSHLAVLGVIPYGDLWTGLSYQADAFLFHLHLMAHPAPFPEQLIGADPDRYFGYFLDTWATEPEAIPTPVRAAYLAAARSPEAIAAVCADYRSGAFVDGLHDQADRAHERQLQMPVVAIGNGLGGAPPPFDFEAVWKSWAPRLHTIVLDGGHLLPEDRPVEVAAAVRDLVATPA